MARETIPEIKRCNLAHTALQLKALGIMDVANFDFLEPPSSHQMAEVRLTIPSRPMSSRSGRVPHCRHCLASTCWEE